ncbi:hypothetical protein ACHAWF_003967 [Thalassiosira exigua]
MTSPPSSSEAPERRPPPLRVAPGASAIPGDRLGPASRAGTSLIPGPGTYLRRGHLHASVLGTVRAVPLDDDGGGAADDDDGGASGRIGGKKERWIASVVGREGADPRGGLPCPRAGALVLGRVGRVIRPTHATVDVVASVPEGAGKAGGGPGSKSSEPFAIPFREPFSGTLRQNEVRPNGSLEVKIEECVRPGDLILARVHAEGERDYVLTTAEAELGVIRAVCEGSGREMRPVSWKEMQCPVSMAREGRKVAKPRQMRTA